MGANCCGHNHNHNHGHDHDLKFDPDNKAFHRVLWLALILNGAMFLVEVIFGVLSHSLALKADAIDFFGDSLNYAVTLFVIGSALQTKARVSLVKASFMLIFSSWVLVEAILHFFSPQVPNSFTMSWVGFVALLVNGLVAVLLFKYRDGDSNMQSVWLCSRNDALGNLAIIVASAGVYWWGKQWPDLLVAIFMSGLAVSSGIQIIRFARNELAHGNHHDQH